MSPAQYEMQYGSIPEEDDENVLIADDSNGAQAADYGFGGHFLLDDNVETYDDPLYTKPMVVDIPKVCRLCDLIDNVPISKMPTGDIMYIFLMEFFTKILFSRIL